MSVAFLYRITLKAYASLLSYYFHVVRAGMTPSVPWYLRICQRSLMLTSNFLQDWLFSSSYAHSLVLLA